MYDINEEDINSILNSIRVNDDGTVEVVNISECQEDTTPEIPQEEIYIGDIPSEESQDNQTSEIQEDNVMSEVNELLESEESNMENPNADLYQLSNIDIDETTARFSGAVWFEEIQKTDILLAGVGGIGSYVVFLLSRMKPNSITIFDNDVVEEVNMAGQLYSLSDIGIGKVNAMSRMVTNYSGYYDLNIKKELFTNSSEYEDIMICGFDNMKARKVFFNRWLTNLNTNEDKKKDCLFIDGRLAAEKFQVLAITGDDEYSIKRYKDEFLFSDEEAEETLCSYKQTTYMANMIGSVMVNLFTNFMANKAGSPIPRSLPFLTSYTGDFLMFNTEY